MPVEPIPCAAPEPEPPTPPCCSPGIASTGLCLADGTPISVLAVSACGDCGADAAAPEVSGWLNLLTGAFTAGSPPAGTKACAGQPVQFEVGQWCDLDADGEVIAPVLVEYEYDDNGQLVGVRTLTPVGDPYTVTGTLGICPGPVDEVEYVILCDVQADGSVVEFLRSLVPNGDDTSTARDTTLDGATPYTATGTVGVCHPPEPEPCASTVSTLRLCDLNPDVEPNEDGKRCAQPFLRHLVHDCAGALTESRDTEMDGTTPYTPVEIVDCGSGGVPALSELLWPQSGIAEDPAGVARRDYIYSVTNPETGDVAQVKLHASSAAPGGCGAYDPASPVFNNPTTYTLVLDDVAQQMSTFRLDLLDFDVFEGITNLSPIPSRVEGDVTWNGSTIKANQNNITAYVYFDRPPAQIAYRYGNTGGGSACSAVRFQGMTLIPDGCCGCSTNGGGECCPQPECRNSSTLLLCDVPADGEPDPTVTDTAPGLFYPYPTGLPMAGAQTLWDGGALTLPPGTGPQPGTTGTVRTLAAKVQAPRPACDTGTAHVAVSVDVEQLGPDTGCAITGAARLFNGSVPVATVLPPNDAAVGWSGTLTVEADVPAADLAAGNLVFFVALDTYDDSPQACPGSPRKSSWKLSGCTAAVVYEQTGCATQILRTVTVDCETGAVLTVTDTTLGGDPYSVTGEVGECTTGGGDCCPTEECRDTSTVLLCDSTGGPPALDPAAVSVRAAAPPVAAMTAKYPNHRWQDADATAVQAVVDGGAASWGNTDGLDNWTRPDWFVWGGFGFSLADSPQCGTWDDAGDVVLTMRVKVINQGPHQGVDADGVFAVFNGTTWIGAKSVQNSLPVGASSTLTLDPFTVAVADLPHVVAVLALELKQGTSEKTWTVQEFTYSLAPVPDSGTAVPGCEQTQFLRTLVTNCTGEIVSTSDTTLDGKPYEVGGEVGQCTPASGGGTPQPEPCQANTVIEACRCDDTDGDGVSDTDYVELLAVDCDGSLTNIGTYTPDLSAPYIPVAPVPCETDGAPTATGVQAHRVELAAGETWNVLAWPTLQSVTAVARGAGTITTADGTSSLVAGESVTWSVARDDDALLTGPLTITADTGTIAVSFTTGTTL